MKRKLSVITISLLLVMSMAAPVFAATNYYAISKMSITSYEDDEFGDLHPSYTQTIQYKYNNKKDLTKIIYSKDDFVKYDYKYKNGKKKTMTIKNGSWDGAKIYYNSKGQRYKMTHDTVNTKYYFNKKGYVKRIQHSKSWEMDKRHKETWVYSYNGSKLKTAEHKLLTKAGKLLEREIYTFNSKGLMTETYHEYGEASLNYSSTPEKTTYTYKYKNGKVKSVMKKRFYVNEDGTEDFYTQYKYTFSYTTKKITASRYRMMILNLLKDYYGYNGPGTWF